MKKKLRVVVLMGGRSSEREISLLSGKEILANIDKNAYSVSSVEIPKNGNKWIDQLLRLKPDLVFIALHGTFGEDGSIQGMLEQLGISYTGSGILASAIGMDKILFKKIMRIEKIPVPKDISYIPCFVKPSKEGSSVGASPVFKQNMLKPAIKLAKKFSDDVLVEEYIKGIELTCAVIGNEDPVALPVIEIHPLKAKFFDYKSKYKINGSEEIVPAGISKNIAKKVQELSIKVYKIIGCSGFARVDFILKDNKYPIVLEINTIPGLTKMSLVPKAAKGAGISFSKLIDTIINLAVVK
ncbi:MAG: D-alanine--D-alanine ligase [Candidatus Woesebacteria bacterium]|nr:D-alanine--D-alanine ligase [Candidatus Woesebacteria bacterium]